jgi:hypothetical protein
MDPQAEELLLTAIAGSGAGRRPPEPPLLPTDTWTTAED